MDEEYAIYKDSTYDIISKVAYLIGIPKRIFENENQPPKLEIYERLDSKTMKAEHPTLCKQYTTKTSYRRFTVKAG